MFGSNVYFARFNLQGASWFRFVIEWHTQPLDKLSDFPDDKVELVRREASWGEPEQDIWRCLHTAQHIHRKRIDLKTPLKVNTNKNGYSSPFLKKRTRTRFEKAITISYLICQILYSLTFVLSKLRDWPKIARVKCRDLKINCFLSIYALYISYPKQFRRYFVQYYSKDKLHAIISAQARPNNKSACHL